MHSDSKTNWTGLSLSPGTLQRLWRPVQHLSSFTVFWYFSLHQTGLGDVVLKLSGDRFRSPRPSVPRTNPVSKRQGPIRFGYPYPFEGQEKPYLEGILCMVQGQEILSWEVFCGKDAVLSPVWSGPTSGFEYNQRANLSFGLFIVQLRICAGCHTHISSSITSCDLNLVLATLQTCQDIPLFDLI